MIRSLSSPFQAWIKRNYSLRAEVTVIVLLTPIISIGLLYTGGGILLPLAQSLIIIYFFIPEVYRNRLWRAAGLVLLWSLLLTMSIAGVFAASGCKPSLAGMVINGRSYSEEMFSWVNTGLGAEGDSSLFMAPKIKELAVFTLASLLTAGTAGLFMGAVLLNYMNTYYGLLVWAGSYSPVIIAMGWPIYAIIRVVGYVFLGTILARTMIVLVRDRSFKGLVDGDYKRMLIYALILIILDFILKATVANMFYQPLLKTHMDPERFSQCLSVLRG